MPTQFLLPYPRLSPVDVVKWGASFAQIGGYAASGFGWTPWNIPLFVLGVLGWLAVGVIWRDRALISVHVVALAALLIGIATQ